MDISRSRTISAKDAVLVLTAIVLPVHIWAFLHVLEELPAWLLRMDLWDLLGVLSYALVFAFFESLLFFLVLVGLGLLAPRRLFGPHFVEIGSVIVIILSLWAIAAQENFGAIRNFNLPQMLLLSGLFVLSLVVVTILIHRQPRLHSAVRAVMRRLSPLAGFYLAIDLVCLLLLVVRNF